MFSLSLSLPRHRQIGVILLISLLFSPLLLASRVNAQAATPRKRALLIGVSRYAGAGGTRAYEDLSSDADVQAIKRVLKDRYGFSDTDENNRIITLVSEKDTRKAAIRQAFEELIRWVQGPGDIIYIHFSGHGDLLAGGYMAALIPSDYRYRANSTRYDPNVITEQEFGAWLTRLKEAGPGGVFLSFDCCHSGNITGQTRGKPPVRRTRNAGRFPKPLPVPPDSTALSRGERAGDSRMRGGRRFASPAERGFFALTACRFDEEALETPEPVPMLDGNGKPVRDAQGKIRLTSMGRLSYALVGALVNPRVRTYRDLLDAVSGTISARYGARQTPQFDGDRDKLVFNSEARVPETYVPVYVQANRIFLKAGQVQGMTLNSTFALYLNGTTAFKEATPFASKATVVAVDLLESEIKVEGVEPTDSRLVDARAVETEHHYDAGALRVELTGEAAKSPAGPAIQAMLARLKAQNVVETAASPEKTFQFQIKPLSGADGASPALALVSLTDQLPMYLGDSRWRDNRIPLTLPPAEIAAVLEKGIKQQYKADLLRKMDNSDRSNSLIAVEARLLPCEVTFPNPNAPGGFRFKSLLPPARLRDQANGIWTAVPDDPRQSDYFIVQVRNRGNSDAYIYVLDIDSEGRVTALWPPTSQLNAGRVPRNTEDWVSVGVSPAEPRTFRVAAPYGSDVIKVLATPQETDLSLLVDDTEAQRGQGARARGAETALGHLLRMAASGTRSAGAYVPSSWDAATIPLTVVPRTPPR